MKRWGLYPETKKGTFWWVDINELVSRSGCLTGDWREQRSTNNTKDVWHNVTGSQSTSILCEAALPVELDTFQVCPASRRCVESKLLFPCGTHSHSDEVLEETDSSLLPIQPSHALKIATCRRYFHCYIHYFHWTSSQTHPRQFR